jgi:hypothetical protein
MEAVRHRSGRGSFIARVRGELYSGLPLDPFGISDGAVAIGREISGNFWVADGGYQYVVPTAVQIDGHSDGRPGLIGIELDFGGATFVQRDTSFNQVTYTRAAAGEPYGTQELNANDFSSVGTTTQIILSQLLAIQVEGTTLQALVDKGFMVGGGHLKFFAFADGTKAGGFAADVQAGTYAGVL